MNLRLPFPVSCVLASVTLVSFAHAQSAPATVASTGNEEPLRLSEFSVSSDTNHGYGASETMTGSRVATQIKDLPFSVNVLTSEFFTDFAIFDLNDTFTYIGGFTGLDIGGGFNLRGFTSTSQLRDGFLRLGRYGASNVDRIEVIKGPNASGLYGRSSPGGMVNMISKQPKPQESETLTVAEGSYKTSNVTAELTGSLPFAGKTYYVLTLGALDRVWDGAYTANHNREGYLALKHDFADGSHLMISGEYFLQTRHAPTAAPPLVTDQRGTATTTDDVVVGYDWKLAGINPYGPHSELNRGNSGVTGLYDKALNDVFSFRAATNYYNATRWDYNQNTGFGAIAINQPANATTGIVPTPTTARGATPTKGLIFENGGGAQFDLVAHDFFFNRKVESRTLLTGDFNDYYRYDPTWNYGTSTNPDIVAWNAVRTIALNPDLSPAAPISYFPKPFDWGNEVLTRLTRRRTTVLGGLIRQQTIFFNGRLLTYIGARFDAVRFLEHDYVTVPTAAQLADIPGYYIGKTIQRRVNETKPNVGFNYKVTESLRAYANYSESYFVDQTTNPLDVASSAYKSETAAGYDYGIKGSYFKDTLNFTLGGYYITRQNVSVTDVEETPLGSGNFVSVTRRDGDQLVRGWEADFNWQPDPAVTLGGSFGNVNSLYTNFGSASPEVIGRSVNGVAPENGSIYGKYNFTNASLRGLSFNLLATYVSSTPSEIPNTGDTFTVVNGSRVLTSSTGQWKLRTPSYTLWQTGLHYTFKTPGRLLHTVGLNVNNLFNKYYLKTSSKILGDSRSIFVSYSLHH